MQRWHLKKRIWHFLAVIIVAATLLNIIGVPLAGYGFHHSASADALSEAAQDVTTSTSMPLPPTATYIPTATPIPAPATPTPLPTATPAPAVANFITGPRAPGVLTLQVNAAATEPNGVKSHISQSFGVFVPSKASADTLDWKVGVPTLDTVPELTGDPGEQNNAGIGMVFEVNATNSSNGQPIHQLDPQHPVILQSTYDPTQVAGVDPTTLLLCYFDIPSGDWRALPTTLDTFHHILTATTTHFTLFAVRVTARTQAQINMARARLATLSAAGSPQVSVLPVSPTIVGGSPLVVSVPSSPQHPPFSVQVTGAPGVKVRIVFAVAGETTVQTLALDARGYATTAFVPSPPLFTAQTVHVTVTIPRNAAAITRSLTLLPGQKAGPLPAGAPFLEATLSSPTVKVGATGPLLTVTTVAHATVYGVLARAGKPITSLNGVIATADAHGSATLSLPPVPGTLFSMLAPTSGSALVLQVIVTSSWHGDSTQVTLPLTVTP